MARSCKTLRWYVGVVLGGFVLLACPAAQGSVYNDYPVAANATLIWEKVNLKEDFGPGVSLVNWKTYAHPPLPHFAFDWGNADYQDPTWNVQKNFEDHLTVLQTAPKTAQAGAGPDWGLATTLPFADVLFTFKNHHEDRKPSWVEFDITSVSYALFTKGQSSLARIKVSASGDLVDEDTGIPTGEKVLLDKSVSNGGSDIDQKDFANQRIFIKWNDPSLLHDQSSVRIKTELWAFAAVPEPASIALLGLGGLGALWRGRIRRA
jgi:hypothetical protein